MEGHLEEVMFENEWVTRVTQVKRDGAQHPGSETSMCKGPEVRKSWTFGRK